MMGVEGILLAYKKAHPGLPDHREDLVAFCDMALQSDPPEGITAADVSALYELKLMAEAKRGPRRGITVPVEMTGMDEALTKAAELRAALQSADTPMARILRDLKKAAAYPTADGRAPKIAICDEIHGEKAALKRALDEAHQLLEEARARNIKLMDERDEAREKLAILRDTIMGETK